MNNTQKLSTWIVGTLKEAAWAPLSVIFVYGIGLVFHLYDRLPRLDVPTHLMGGVAITYLYRVAIRNSQTYLGDVPHLVQIFFAFTATGTTAVLWEFCENISDYFLGTHHVHGLTDTLTDLVMGFLGALLVTLFYKKR